MENGVGPSSLSDALLDSICLLGPIERCQRRLAEYRAAGVDVPILMPPLGVGGARAVIEAFSLEPSIRVDSRYGLAPKTIRCSSPCRAGRWASSSGPGLPPVAGPVAAAGAELRRGWKRRQMCT